jgi:hypothetical protein
MAKSGSINARLARLVLLLLALSAAFVGSWAPLAPHSFYADLHGAGRHWVAIAVLQRAPGARRRRCSWRLASCRAGAHEACRRIAPAAPRFGGIALSLAHTCPHGPLQLDGVVVQPSENAVKPADFRLGGPMYVLAVEHRGSRLAAGRCGRHRRSTASWRQTAEDQRDLAGSGTCGFHCPWHVHSRKSGTSPVRCHARAGSVPFVVYLVLSVHPSRGHQRDSGGVPRSRQVSNELSNFAVQMGNRAWTILEASALRANGSTTIWRASHRSSPNRTPGSYGYGVGGLLRTDARQHRSLQAAPWLCQPFVAAQ